MSLLLSVNGFADFIVQKPLHSVPEADLVVGETKIRGALTCCPFGMAAKEIQASAYPYEPQVFFRFETTYKFPAHETWKITNQMLGDIWDCKFTLELDSNQLLKPVVVHTTSVSHEAAQQFKDLEKPLMDQP